LGGGGGGGRGEDNQNSTLFFLYFGECVVTGLSNSYCFNGLEKRKLPIKLKSVWKYDDFGPFLKNTLYKLQPLVLSLGD